MMILKFRTAAEGLDAEGIGVNHLATHWVACAGTGWQRSKRCQLWRWGEGD
jgi:hypothetical protein